MRKPSNRESVRLGHVHTRHGRQAFAAALESAMADGKAAAERNDRILASGLYGTTCSGTGCVPKPNVDPSTVQTEGDLLTDCPGCADCRADPGSIVGLDGFIPGSDTPKHGDPERTDPDAD